MVKYGNPPQETELTPLILAAGRGKLRMVEILVKSEAPVNCESPVSTSITSTPLLIYLQVISRLIVIVRIVCIRVAAFNSLPTG